MVCKSLAIGNPTGVEIGPVTDTSGTEEVPKFRLFFVARALTKDKTTSEISAAAPAVTEVKYV